MTGIEQWLLPRLGIKAPPWTVHRKQADHLYLKPAAECPQIPYPKAGQQDQLRPPELGLHQQHESRREPARAPDAQGRVGAGGVNLALRRAEARYCPAGVYEFVKNDDGSERLQINAQNCVHCKTCDIKDPTQNIVWVTPEGGGGPNYAGCSAGPGRAGSAWRR